MNPVVRSSDMTSKDLETLLQTIRETLKEFDIIEDYHNLANKIKKNLDQKFSDQKGVSDSWSVVIGKQFAVSTDVQRKWFAHIYLKGSISMLAWKTN